jgi:hypothetical protein
MTCACAVVSAPENQRAFVDVNFAGVAVHDVVTGGGQIYVLHLVNGRGADMRFIDPFDGAVLVECQTFDDEPAARSWIASDIVLRTTQIRRMQ